MEPLVTAEVQIFQEKLLGKKWKTHFARIYPENALGKARIELFASEAKMKEMEVTRTVLLEHSVAIRPGKTENGVAFVKIQFQTEPPFQFSCEKLAKVVDVLSGICFPKKYVTIAPSTSSLESPTVELAPIDFRDEYPVLKLMSVNNRETTEGFFTLALEETLRVDGEQVSHQIPYSSLIWVATGEHCFGFEAENVGILEFATGDPLQIVDHLRNFVKFGCVFTPPRVKTICRFNRYYHPTHSIGSATASPELSNNSTMESTGSDQKMDREIRTASSQTSVKAEQDFMSKVVEGELHRSYMTGDLRRTPSGQTKKSFLIGTRKKKGTESRSDFEENANVDFVRLDEPEKNFDRPAAPADPPPKPLILAPKDSEIALKFKQELQRSLEVRQKSAHSPALIRHSEL